MTQGYTLTKVEWNSPLAEEMKALRVEVFVEEQGVPLEEEIDDIDPVSVHLLIRDSEGRALATGRLYDPDGSGFTGRIGRMAVAQRARGKGLGRVILRAPMAEGLKQGFARFLLDAQTHAIPFYEDSGFAVCGEEHLDCGIPHKLMDTTAEIAAVKVAGFQFPPSS